MSIPFFFHLCGEMVAQVIVKAAQNLVATIEKDGFDAEAGKDAGEFHSDVTTTDNHHAARQALEMEGFIRGDGQFVARQMTLARKAWHPWQSKYISL